MDQRRPISPRARLLLATAGLAVGAAIVTARVLAPDVRGYGTHEQLGWSRCWFRQRFDLPCPTCGMTTAWAHATRGQATAAVAANAAGAVACGLAAIAAPWAIASAAAGRWLVAQPTLRVTLSIGTALLVLALFDWARRLISN